MTTRDDIMQAVQAMVDSGEVELDEDAPVDEVVAAIQRQIDVFEGTLVMLTNACTLATLQLQNLRAEVELLTTPPPGPVAEPRQPVKPVQRTPSGAVREADLPQHRLNVPEFCGHSDALIIDTASGPQKVCPDCPEQSHG